MSPEDVSNQTASKTKPNLKINVMVVDDDATSLSIVSAMLKSFDGMNIKLVVFSVSSAVEALTTLRLRKENFDLVVSDLHMPKMNGLELQKRVEEEFKLPVIIMSSDDKESVILKTLEKGAAFYLVKPINRNDLKNIWQYAIAAKKRKSMATNEMNKTIRETSMSSPDISYEDDNNVDSASSVNEGNGKKGKKRPNNNDLDDEDEDNCVSHKKAKIVWTNSLHNRFLEAISYLGPEKAVPKKILDFMCVPGLRRENVASHLQKYRMFLKKVAERDGHQTRSFDRSSSRPNFTSSSTSSKLQQQLNAPTTFHPGIGWNNPTSSATPSPSASNIGRPRRVPPNVDSSRSNLLSNPSIGQSSLPSGSSNRPLSGNLNPSFQANPNSANGATNKENSLAMSTSQNGMVTNTNSFRRILQENKERLTRLSLGWSTTPKFRLGSDEIRRANPVSAMGNIGSGTANVLDISSYLCPGANYNHTGFQGANEISRDNISNNGQNSSNWPRNENLINISPIENGTYGSSNNYSAQDDSFRGFSSWGFQRQRPATNQGSNPPLPLPPSLPANLEIPNKGTTFNGMSSQQHLGREFNLVGGLKISNNVNINSSSKNSDLYRTYLAPNQAQGADGAENANVPNNLFLSLPDVAVGQILNSVSFNFGNNASWTDQTNTPQLQGQEVVNTNSYGNANANDNTVENLNPTLDHIQGSAQFMDLEINDLLTAGDNAMSANLQDWGDEFMGSSFGDDPFQKKY